MTLLIAGIIFYASTIKTAEGAITGLNLATFYHFGIFFMFSFFLLLTVKSNKIDKKAILITLLISIIYAFSDEFHQFFIPGRFASLKDVLIDSTGSLCSILLIFNIERFNKP